jgi:hypothetical protein
MKKTLYTLFIVLMMLSSGISQNTFTDPNTKVPSLNGHAFPSMSHFRSSFVTTNIQANLGFGITSPLKISGITVGDYELFSFEGNILFLSMDVYYQQRFNHWLAMYFSFGMAGRVGTDLSMILADGVNTIGGGKIGWLIKVYQNKKFNLSGTLHVSNVNGKFINVTRYFEELINDDPDPSLSKSIPSMSAGIGVMGAYAFSPTFGMQFDLEYSVGESFNRDGAQGYFSVSIMGDADFNPKFSVPVGLALGYTLSSAPDIFLEDGELSNLFNLKVGYTGSDEFELGLQVSNYYLKLQSVEDKTTISLYSLVLKLYF